MLFKCVISYSKFSSLRNYGIAVFGEWIMHATISHDMIVISGSQKKITCSSTNANHLQGS